MKIRRFAILMAGLFATVSIASAQSYYDDDIYYDASKDKAAKTAQSKSQNTSGSNGNYYKVATYGNGSATVVVTDYPSADNYTVNGTRTISVDDYNRRGIFATDSLSADSTATDFQYTRRIEQYYNPEIVSGSGDTELAQIYYMEPQTVNIYVNTPSAYWGYAYFYPSLAWSSPYYWNNYWRWNSSWYWNSWYDPYWSFGWGPSWAWGPGWGWGPAWGPSWNWAWGPSWGWGPSLGRPYNPRHPGAIGSRPGNQWAGSRPTGTTGSRPGLINGGRHQGTAGWGNTNTNARPNNYSTTGRPGVRPSTTTNNNQNNGYSRPGTNNSNSYSRPNNTNNNTYNRPSNTNGGRTGGFSTGGSRGGFGGGSRSTGGGRGRH